MKQIFTHISLLMLICACSTYLSVAMTNSGAVAHVASQEALRELSAKLGK